MQQKELKDLLRRAIKHQKQEVENFINDDNPHVAKMGFIAHGRHLALEDVLRALEGNKICLEIATGEK